MDIDRLLAIHQSHSLMKIGAINKQMLIAQYAQCEQISALQKEIAASNILSRQILNNQLKDIKHKELLAYYKSLAYAMKEATGCIEAENDIAFKCFLYELYCETIITNTREAKSNLEEISDKEYCNKIELKMQAICNTCSLSKTMYEKSDFALLLKTQPSYQERQKTLIRKRQSFFLHRYEIEKELSSIKPLPIKNPNIGCGIKFLFTLSILLLVCMVNSVFEDISALPILFILFFVPIFIPLVKLIRKDKKWKENYNQYVNEIELKRKNVLEKLDALKYEIEEEENLLRTSQYVQTKKAISLTYPHWEDTVIKIDSYIPKMETAESKRIKLYKDLYKVAKYIVKVQKVNISIIQRLLACGFTKAAKYLKQLSEIGIVNENKVLVKNEEELNDYWNFIKKFLS